MKKSLIALAFGTLALGIAEFVMMGILPDVAQSLGISIPVAGSGSSQISTEKHPAGLGGHHSAGFHAGSLLHELLDAAGSPLHLGIAPWSLLRRCLHSGRALGGQATRDGCRVHHDSRHDHSQSFRCSPGHSPQLAPLLAFPVFPGNVCQPHRALLYLEMGTRRRRIARQRLQTPIRFPQERRSLDDTGGDNAGQWRHILLV